MNPPYATGSPDVSVLLVTWNAGDDIAGCLESVLRDKSAGSIEVIVVDNNSSDCTVDVVRSFPEVRLFQTGGNLGFALAMNIALKAAQGRYLFLLNPDARLVNDAVGHLVSFLDSHPDAGCASPQLLNNDGSVALFVTRRFPSVTNTVLRQFGLRRLFPQSTWMGREYLAGWDRESPRTVPCLSGAALMIPRSVYLEVGSLDTVLPMYFEDLDYCKRIADKGNLLYYVPGAKVLHVGGKSASASTAKRLLRGMEDGEAVWLFLRRYRGAAHAAAFRVVIAVGSLFRLMAIYPLRFLPQGLVPFARTAAQHARHSSALLQWALVPRPIFYTWINAHFTRS